jgi:hypothetical protein
VSGVLLRNDGLGVGEGGSILLVSRLMPFIKGNLVSGQGEEQGGSCIRERLIDKHKNRSTERERERERDTRERMQPLFPDALAASHQSCLIDCNRFCLADGRITP